MKKIFIFIIMICILVGCTQSPAAIEKAIAKTQTAMPTETKTPTPTPTLTPTSTPTPIPLSEIDLEDILLLKSDLPEGYQVNPFGRFTDNPLLKNINGYDQMILQEFHKTNEGIGLVAVYLFTNIDKIDSTFDSLEQKIKQDYGSPKNTTKFGDKGLIYYQPVIGNISISIIIFTRCNSLVYVAKSMDDKNSTVISSYSEKLDARLGDLLCQEY